MVAGPLASVVALAFLVETVRIGVVRFVLVAEHIEAAEAETVVASGAEPGPVGSRPAAEGVQTRSLLELELVLVTALDQQCMEVVLVSWGRRLELGVVAA